jgi:phospholipase C
MLPRLCLSAAALAVVATVQAGSLKDVKHIVLFMQENRAFDHVSCRVRPDSGLKHVANSAC